MIYTIHTRISCRYFVLDINCYLTTCFDFLKNNQRMLGYIFRMLIFYLANICTFFSPFFHISKISNNLFFSFIKIGFVFIMINYVEKLT
jgi:hypothetical protein